MSVPVRQPLNYDDPRWVCLCGVHVHEATFVIAVVSIVLSLLSIPAGIIALICSIFLLIGQRNGRPGYYLPWLVLHAIGLVMLGIVCVFLAIAGVLLLVGSKNLKPEEFHMTGAMLSIYIPAILFALLVEGYMFNVVHRDYKYVQEMRYTQPPAYVA
ncbi:hypothetical protein M3Y99_00459500 [Aphelenchoides fujianensis]|nr:hypothetical protein M3Y99_00459500 [Aphelenchoides fujianensis]